MSGRAVVPTARRTTEIDELAGTVQTAGRALVTPITHSGRRGAARGGRRRLSLDELTTGPVHESAISRLHMYLDEPLMGWRAEDVYPVAWSDDDRDLVVVGRSGTPVASRVAWLDGGVVETYADLEEWFRSVLEMHLEELAGLQGVGLVVP